MRLHRAEIGLASLAIRDRGEMPVQAIELSDRKQENAVTAWREPSMKAIYSTHKGIRVFVFGVPEGWQVAAYDLVKHEWIARVDALHDTLRQAKADALAKVAEMLGKHPVKIEWH
jgi:hypothetical protein